MARAVSEREVAALLVAPARKRYEYFIKQAADWKEMWSLQGPDGWVVMGDEAGREVVPVWPHAPYAQACAADDWADCSPAKISLSHWLDAWIPGMKRDGRLVAVFPTPAQHAIVVTPDELKAHLEEELEEYE